MPRFRGLFLWGLAALAAAWTAAQVSLARTDAPVVDEPIHFLDGALAVDWGDPAANPEHPPLVKMLAAATAGRWRERAPAVHSADAGRAAAPALLIRPRDSFGPRIFAARLPEIAIGLAAIFAAALWGRAIGGDAGGLGSAALLAASTLWGAHAHLVTTDVAVASLAFCGAALLGLGPPTAPRAIAAGLFFGGALTAKYSAIFLVPILLAAWIASAPGRPRIAAAALSFGVALIAATAIVTVASRHATAAEVRSEIASARAGATANRLPAGGMTPLLFVGERLAAVSPGVGRYCLGAALVASPAYRREGYPAFFHGRITTSGAVGYFPAAAAFKFGTVALLFGLAGLALGRKQLPLVAVAAPVFYFAAALPAHYLLGARYLLPVYPFLCLWAAPLGRRAPRLLLGAAAAALVGAAWTYPYWMADRSLLGRAIGPLEEWFADSSLDWGQDLGRLAARADARKVPVSIVSGSEFGGLPELYPVLRFPDASGPLPPGDYSVVRWGPFIAAAAEPAALSRYPPELRALVVRLRDDYAIFERRPGIPTLSTPGMRGVSLGSALPR